MPLFYLKQLKRLYETWISSYEMSDVLVLATDNLNYSDDLVHRLEVMGHIEAMLSITER